MKISLELTQFEAHMAHLVLGPNDHVREPVASAIKNVVDKLEAAGALDDS